MTKHIHIHTHRRARDAITPYKGYLITHSSLNKNNMYYIKKNDFQKSIVGSAESMEAAKKKIDELASASQDAVFSNAQIEALRREYAKIETADPNGPGYHKLIALLDRLGQEELKQLSKAGIKFVSKLALNRLWELSRAHDEAGEKIVEVATGTHEGVRGVFVRLANKKRYFATASELDLNMPKVGALWNPAKGKML